MDRAVSKSMMQWTERTTSPFLYEKYYNTSYNNRRVEKQYVEQGQLSPSSKK